MSGERRRTILHLDYGRELRGGQWQVIRLMRGLRNRGHRNLLLAPANSPLLEHSVREGFQCGTIGIASFVWASKLADIVHAHDARSHSLAALWGIRPLLVARRVAFPVGRNPFSHWKYGRPKLYAAVSQTVASELSDAGVPDAKIRVIYDGVPLLADRWQSQGPVVVPRFNDPRKSDTLSLEAARLAHAPVLRSTCLESDLDGAGMLVYLTESEGLGSAVLLAMSAGVPVIASDIGGLRELVRHRETGLLVPNRLDAVIAAIRTLRDSPDLAVRLAANARRQVIEQFSEDRMISETSALYEMMLEDRNGYA